MRLKPKYNGKNKKRFGDSASINQDEVIRFSKEILQKRVKWILEKEFCQVCKRDDIILDYPHHAEYGMGIKDDRYLINICIHCHREIHSGSYFNVPATREDLKLIGWNNHLEFLALTI